MKFFSSWSFVQLSSLSHAFIEWMKECPFGNRLATESRLFSGIFLQGDAEQRLHLMPRDLVQAHNLSCASQTQTFAVGHCCCYRKNEPELVLGRTRWTTACSSVGYLNKQKKPFCPEIMEVFFPSILQFLKLQEVPCMLLPVVWAPFCPVILSVSVCCVCGDT